MASTASFRVLKNELLNVLKQMQRVERSAKKKLSTLEITIIKNTIKKRKNTDWDVEANDN